MTTADRIAVTTTTSGVRFGVRVIPRASRTTVGGVREGRLVVRVTAPPVDRAANEAAVTALAGALQVPERSVLIAAGATARNKMIEVRGLSPEDVRAKLAELGA